MNRHTHKWYPHGYDSATAQDYSTRTDNQFFSTVDKLKDVFIANQRTLGYICREECNSLSEYFAAITELNAEFDFLRYETLDELISRNFIAANI
jgi:hypothetical protein